MSGVVQGQDRVARRLLVASTDGGFRPECHKAVSKNVNRLEADLARMNQGQLIEALDAFYAEKSNRRVELKWAVQVVMQKLQGPAEGQGREAGPVPPRSP
jgi:hypothetical protein